MEFALSDKVGEYSCALKCLLCERVEVVDDACLDQRTLGPPLLRIRQKKIEAHLQPLRLVVVSGHPLYLLKSSLSHVLSLHLSEVKRANFLVCAQGQLNSQPIHHSPIDHCLGQNLVYFFGGHQFIVVDRPLKFKEDNFLDFSEPCLFSRVLCYSGEKLKQDFEVFLLF